MKRSQCTIITVKTVCALQNFFNERGWESGCYHTKGQFVKKLELKAIQGDTKGSDAANTSVCLCIAQRTPFASLRIGRL
jgi:hypothetical protein